MPRGQYAEDDRDVVVIVGSGAGGGTLANELCQAGVPTVVLEAGPHLTGEDYHQEEWPAFNQMAWTDSRTTSGSWRVAKGAGPQIQVRCAASAATGRSSRSQTRVQASTVEAVIGVPCQASQPTLVKAVSSPVVRSRM